MMFLDLSSPSLPGAPACRQAGGIRRGETQVNEVINFVDPLGENLHF
jgi:hypothetical protein